MTEARILLSQKKGSVADMHTHSRASHDSQCPLEEMLRSQLARGTHVFAVTDHADAAAFYRRDLFTALAAAHREIRLLNERYEGECHLLAGVEIGDGVRFPSVYSRIHDFLEYDVILGSVHITGYPGMRGAFAHEDFSLMSPWQREDFLRSYFEQVHQVAEELDVDVLCHLTCPLRYLVGKYGIPVSLEPHLPRLTQILETVIRRGLALEVNCSSLETMGEPLPSFSLLSLYRSLGGERITLASDAHRAEQASRHFPFVIGKLKELGFSSVLFYEKRKPYSVLL